MPLNNKQKLAICCNIKKPTVVVSGPGTGKTKVLTERALFLINKQHIDPKNIQLLAFTNSAADEIQTRIEAKLPELNSQISSTFHKWTIFLLQKGIQKKYKNFRIIQRKQEEELLTFALKKFAPTSSVKPIDFINLISNSITSETNIKSLFSKKYPKIINELHQVYKEYERLKIQKKLWNLYDPILLTLKHVKDSSFAKKVVKRFPFILLDEAQDLTAVQWEILHNLSNRGAIIFCVGDPAQAIFGFAGANVSWFNSFQNKFKQAQFFEIIKNYRSTQEIVNLSNWIRKLIDKPNYKVEAYNSKGSLPIMMQFEKLINVAEWMTKDIIMRLTQRPSENIAIICRNKYELAIIDKQLIKSDISSLKYEITLTTVHKAKGGAWDCCYVIDPRFESKYDNERTLEICLLYVAITRAKKNLIICLSDNDNVPYQNKRNGELYLLDELPGRLCEFKNT